MIQQDPSEASAEDVGSVLPDASAVDPWPHEPSPEAIEDHMPDYSGPINPVQYLKGRGAQVNPKNRFLKNERVKEHIEAIDDWIEPNSETQYLEENAKGIVNKVD